MNTLEVIFKKTSIDFDAFFHLLRHFNKVDEDFIKQFTYQTKYKEDDLQYQMKKPGSKFRYSFAKNPEELIRNLTLQIDYKSFYISENENVTEIAIEFDHEVFYDGIGFDGIVALRNLSEKEKRNIELIERDGYEVRKLITEKKITWKLNLILHKLDEAYLIATFFPGIYAPPFPNNEIQKEELYEKSLAFWNDHVLLS